MAKAKQIGALALALALALTGCRTQRQAAAPPSPTTEPSAQTLQPTTMRCNFSATVEGISANGQLRWMRDSVVWVSVNKFIELGRARLTPDSLVAYIPPYNQYLRMDMATVRRQFGLDFDSVQTLLLGGDNQLTVSHPRLSEPARVRFSSPTFDTPLTFPFAIPPSAKPLTL